MFNAHNQISYWHITFIFAWQIPLQKSKEYKYPNLQECRNRDIETLYLCDAFPKACVKTHI